MSRLSMVMGPGMQARTATTRRHRGFSIIELVTVVAIAAIMLGFAIPSFQEFVVNYRTSVQTNDLLADLAIARGEAVKFSRNTIVRAEGGNWSAGWIVGTDLDGDGDVTGDEIVKRQGAAQQDFTIMAGLQGGVATDAITFGPSGSVLLPAGGAPIEFAICRPDLDPAKSRGISLLRSGRAESRKADDNVTFDC